MQQPLRYQTTRCFVYDHRSLKVAFTRQVLQEGFSTKGDEKIFSWKPLNSLKWEQPY